MKFKNLSLAISSATIMAMSSLFSPAFSAGKDITIVIAEEPEQRAEQQAVSAQQQAKSLESSIVSLTSASNEAQANARTIETADEVLGSIIDIRV